MIGSHRVHATDSLASVGLVSILILILMVTAAIHSVQADQAGFERLKDLLVGQWRTDLRLEKDPAFHI